MVGKARAVFSPGRNSWRKLCVRDSLPSDPDEKFNGSNLLNSFESGICRLRSGLNPAKILNRKNLSAKSWIDWT